MYKSKIEWTETTWNPTTGCDKISKGCINCYAEKMSLRLKAMGKNKYKNGFEITSHDKFLKEPSKWRKPKIVFVNSMSDIFHKNIRFEFIQKIFKEMNENPQHTFLVLTKRADVLYEYSSKLNWTDNIWMGVTVEDADNVKRIDYLRQSGAKHKFLSCEPLLSDLGALNLNSIDWVIVGGESGPESRPIEEDWVINIKDQCFQKEIPFFFKQWGGVNKKKNGNLLRGQIYNENPTIPIPSFNVKQ